MQQPPIVQPQEHGPNDGVAPATTGTTGKQPFTPPKLTFVAPKLTKQGNVVALTAGLMGSFSP